MSKEAEKDYFPKIDRSGPSLFRLMSEKQNKEVRNTFFFISGLIIFASFGSFFLLRYLIPKIWTNVSKPDAGSYAIGISCIITHIIVFAFIFYARNYDLKKEKEEKELEKAKKTQ